MNPYDILGVSRTASDTDIKAAYRRLVMKFHPDRNPTEEAKQQIVLINQAYDVLSDPQQRARYDNAFFEYFTPPVYQEDPREIYKRDYLRKKRAEEQMEKERRKALEQRAFRFLRIVSLPILAIAVLLNADQLLSTQTYNEVGEEVWRQVFERGMETEVHDFVRTKHFVFEIPEQVFKNYPASDNSSKPEFSIQATAIFKAVMNVSVTIQDQNYRFSNRNLFNSGKLLLWALFLTSLYSAVQRELSSFNLGAALVPPFLLLIVAIEFWAAI